MFTLTSAAAKQIHRAARTSAAQGMALRVAARQADDGSVEYGMGFDEARDQDARLMLEGVAVVIADSHQPFLERTVLDFVELNPDEFNFIFIPTADEQVPPARAGGCDGGSGSTCRG